MVVTLEEVEERPQARLQQGSRKSATAVTGSATWRSRHPKLQHPGLPVRGVNLGGWLLTEKWTCPSLWDELEDDQLLDGAQLQLQSTSSGAWLSADNGGGGSVHASAEVNGWWETFVLWRLADGRFKLRASDGHFVALSGGGHGALLASAADPKDAAKLTIQRSPTDWNLVHVVSAEGSYLQAQEFGDLVVASSVESPGWASGPAVFRMVATPVMQGDFALCNGLGEKAQAVLQKHWSTFITEDDVKNAAHHGLNALRIPVGWWIAYDPSPPWPYVPGARAYLDRTFDWAEQYGLRVLVDLHAVPGSCNGWDLGGSRDGSTEWPEPKNIAKTLEVLGLLAQRYGSHPALLGFQLLNEPRQYVDKEIIRRYYEDGYDVVRQYSPDAIVLLSSYIDGNPADFCDFLADPARWSNVAVDVGHWYSSYTGKGLPADWYIDGMFNNFLPMVLHLRDVYSIPILIGEWSLELSAADPLPSWTEYERYARAETYAWGQADGGWFFYTLKLNTTWDSDCWSFQKATANGWLHSDQWMNPRPPPGLTPLVALKGW